MILGLQQALIEDSFKVRLLKLCHWFDMHRRTVYYRSTKAGPKVKEHLLKPIKVLNMKNPAEAYALAA